MLQTQLVPDTTKVAAQLVQIKAVQLLQLGKQATQVPLETKNPVAHVAQVVVVPLARQEVQLVIAKAHVVQVPKLLL